MESQFDDLPVTREMILDAWAILHHLRRFMPKATDRVLDLTDISNNWFDEILDAMPAHWTDR